MPTVRDSHSKLISALSDFSATSFTELQAAAYVALVKMGEESGSAVAGEAGINRSKIYDILGQLEQMGAVRKVGRDRKARYVAVSPEELLPNLIDRFRQDIDKAKDELQMLKNLEEEVDEVKISLTTLELSELDTNVYEYLISTTENHRVQFTEKLSKGARPSPEVRILDLNADIDERGLILCLRDDHAFLFGTPAGDSVEALSIHSKQICKFLKGLIESWWLFDIPDFTMDEVEKGDMLALAIDKALYVDYEFYNPNGSTYEKKYDRPISFIISDSHLSFYYPHMEKPDEVIPLQFLQTVEIMADNNTISLTLANPKRLLGKLQMRVSSNPFLISNILKFIQRTN